MPQNTHVDLAEASERHFGSIGQDGPHDAGAIAFRAAECARSLVWMPEARTSRGFNQRLQTLAREVGRLVAVLEKPSANEGGEAEEWRRLRDDVRVIRSAAAKLPEAKRTFRALPKVAGIGGQVVPRVVAIAEDLFTVLDNQFIDSEVSEYLRAFQTVTTLSLEELHAMATAFNLVLLERITALAAA